MSDEAVTDGRAVQVANWVINRAIDGFGPITGARDLAAEYIGDTKYKSDDDRIASLIRWETSKNFSTGFAMGLPGIMALPATIPTGLGSAWAIQTRMAATIAAIYGHDLEHDRVRSFAFMCILGMKGIQEPLRTAGVAVTRGLVKNAIGKVSGETLRHINKHVGFRLLTKAGQTGVLNLGKAIPIAGGLVGGVLDGAGCYAVGKTARYVFGPADDQNAA